MGEEFLKFLAKDYKYWAVYVHPNQGYLGRTIIWCRREDALDLSDATPEEQQELFLILGALKAAVQKAFQADWFNYAFLGNEVRHLHGHVVPRYAQPREFMGIIFEDKSYGRRYETDSDFITTTDVLKAVQEKIRSGMGVELTKKALQIIAEKMEQKGIRWAVIGSTNMAIQGMDVRPHDLDLVVRLDDLKIISEIFSGIAVSDVKELPTMTGEPAWEVEVEIGGVAVQMLGEKDTGQYVSKLIGGKTTKVKVNGINVPCLTLEAEADAYTETNRGEKAELIKEFLRSGQ